MQGSICSIEPIRVPERGQRGVGFLLFPNNNVVTAHNTFQGLTDEDRNYFCVSFDWWVAGLEPRRSRYHGWSQSEYGGRYKRCFVFKKDEHRLYGFLCHPKPLTDQRFQFCILVAYAWKVQSKTQEKYLVQCSDLANNTNVYKAAKDLFEPPKGGGHRGKH